LRDAYTAVPWYWAVAGSTTQVWSSASLSYVAITDTTYAAWLARNNPTRIASAGALATVMLQQVRPLVLAKGVQVNSSGTAAINSVYAMKPDVFNRLALITSLVANAKGLPSGTSTFSYPDAAGTYHTFTSTLILNLATALQLYAYSWEQAMLTRVGGGSASLPTTPVAIA
jgi:hypothetical protein